MKKIWSRTLRPGEKWSGNIGRGKYIHFKALGDDANVSMLMYNMLDTSERYNMPDTLKAQFISSLTKGNVLMSDNGRVLASIVEDSLGWHDTISINPYISLNLRFLQQFSLPDCLLIWLRSTF